MIALDIEENRVMVRVVVPVVQWINKCICISKAFQDTTKTT